MDIRKVKKLIEMLEQSKDVGEIEIHEENESVRISRSSTAAPATTTSHLVHATPAEPTPPTATAAPEKPLAATADEEDGTVVRSPMVGTFFSAASPESAPFVKLGDTVSKGDTLCIIEAMKIMNQIEAPTDGTIKAIYTENAEPVEYEQPLMLIK